ncbi:DUF1566 domain-containing protein [Vibrio sp. SCSIO 43136]|uniref:Lcl domain-containing protein n=1 Tax=Vibrio sp. SCSIO 43136 TaxID=2819101 RepID=UPI00207583E0|nr:DUF1566 domain-containing protein [Vibrio sp. SCSIO 43136]USD67781.1 DUF1566 domain-containing protein [Vibrio sp. SCSIO 43136]
MKTFTRKHQFTIAILSALAAMQAQANTLTYPIVDTNQRTCIGLNDVLASCPTKGEQTYGQDAQYQGFQPSYYNNLDGTITDNVTGLMWRNSTDTNGDGVINVHDKMTYEQALAYVASLKTSGYSDWRLPTIKELYSLILFDGQDPSGVKEGSYNLTPFIHIDYFDFNSGDMEAGERLIDSQYATSTKYVSTTMKGDETMFGVNFIDGRIKGYGLTSPRGDEKTFYVMPVRGNTDYGINKFVANSNDTITDHATGLTWQQSDSAKAMDFPTALAFCENLTLAGSDAWRLPNVKELQSIVDYSRSPDTTDSAAIDPLFNATAITNEAGNKDYANYWSSTTHLNTQNAKAGAYVSFGRSMGKMKGTWLDVHGAGAQRSDDKVGDASRYPDGKGPQGDSIRIDNMVRCVTDNHSQWVESPQGESRTQFVATITNTSEQGAMRSKPNQTNNNRTRPEGDMKDPRGGRNPMTDLDRNNDGKLSRQEVRGPLAQDFDRLDRNGDGYLTEDEIPAPPSR